MTLSTAPPPPEIRQAADPAPRTRIIDLLGEQCLTASRTECRFFVRKSRSTKQDAQTGGSSRSTLALSQADAAALSSTEPTTGRSNTAPGHGRFAQLTPIILDPRQAPPRRIRVPRFGQDRNVAEVVRLREVWRCHPNPTIRPRGYFTESPDRGTTDRQTDLHPTTQPQAVDSPRMARKSTVRRDFSVLACRGANLFAAEPVLHHTRWRPFAKSTSKPHKAVRRLDRRSRTRDAFSPHARTESQPTTTIQRTGRLAGPRSLADVSGMEPSTKADYDKGARSACSRGRYEYPPPSHAQSTGEAFLWSADQRSDGRALANPELISLAAGFVDQSTLPCEETEEALRSLWADPAAGTEGPAVRDDGRISAACDRRSWSDNGSPIRRPDRRPLRSNKSC